MSALILVFRLILFYTFISLSDGKAQWSEAVNLCKQKGQILIPEKWSNESSLGYRQDTTMWTSSYILSVNNVKHTALYVEQIPVTEVHRGLCNNNKDSGKLIVLNMPLNYSHQDFKCGWDYSRSASYPDSLLNITSLSVAREVLGLMDFGQKYWLSDISESVYSLVYQCEVFNHVGNVTSSRKSNTAMRFCDEMNNYKCIDGKKYRTAVSLVKYLHHRHGNDYEGKKMNYSGIKFRTAVSLVKYFHDRHGYDRERTNNSDDVVWKVSSLTLSGGIILIGLLVICLKIMRTFGSLKKEKRQLPERRLNDPVYDDDWIQMKQTASLKHDRAVLPSGSALSANIPDTRTSRKTNPTVIRN